MDPKANQEVVVVIERAPSRPTSLCRICHDEEEESTSTMETPCACSGTLKFAHRRCVQRWCDEKGSTLCEVCLQSFEPNYTVAPKKALIDVGVTIRQSVEVSIQEGYHPRNPSISSALLEADDEHSECSPSSRRNASFCHSIALTLALLLLLSDLIPLLGIASDSYAFGILTVLLLRVIGILLPLFVVMRIARMVQKFRRGELRLPLHSEDAEDRDDDIPLQGDHQRAEHSIQIHS